ncbi:Major facilitator superfamily multidrug transporter mfsB [Hyphodiscus hymeniophilus]|uniref:Major facilitator superfamily multidrug transporter mfsB n=1 Tax=Hyphodiscus hymeniophilus TaxID=353542 RepID=A0A9P6VJE3_9HELO|nr:Major facilitator superfamily multidrug transporter mfsB [Hyphodiscus hymeniophilus]
MVLTSQKSIRNPDKFPTLQLFLLGMSFPPVTRALAHWDYVMQSDEVALKRNSTDSIPAIVRLAEPIALTSIFPYAWALVKKFHVGEQEDASFYAGLLISSFALAESLTGMYWGGLSDRIGRKPVLLIGCFGTVISLVLVGFSSNIWFALAGRTLGGFLNGNIGVVQTMVGELVTKPEHEPRAYSVMPFVWSIGTVIGPAIGGTFADPATSFPNTFSPDGLFGRFPYLLPNLVCAFLLMMSITFGYFFLEESHPDMQPRVLLPDSTYVSDETPLMATADAIKAPAVDLRSETYGTFAGSDDSQWQKTYEKFGTPKIFTKRVISLIVALGIFTYHTMTYDHLLPIFLEDGRGETFSALSQSINPLAASGGLGLSVRSVGVIMSTDGLIALFVQAVIFPFAAAKMGVYRLFILVSLCHPLSYFVMPYLVYLPPSFLYPGIYLALSIRNLLCILAYPVILIQIKEASPSPSVMGKINGLAASAGAACRTVAPPIAGYLYGVGSKMDFTALAWYGSAFVAVVGAVQCFSVQREKAPLSEEDFVEYKRDLSRELDKEFPVVLVTEIDEWN